MPMRESYAQTPMRDYLREREVRCFNVEVALHDLQVWRDAAEEFVGLFVGDVA